MYKNIKNNIITVIILGLFIVCMVVSFGACHDDRNDNKLPNYEILESHRGEIYVEDAKILDYGITEIIIISVEQLKEYNMVCEKYNDQYFESYALVLIVFHFSSSEKDIMFKDLAVKGKEVYPVFELYGVLEGAPSSDDNRCNIYSVECTKEILDYQFERVIVINHNNINGGSCYYEGIKNTFS